MFKCSHLELLIADNKFMFPKDILKQMCTILKKAAISDYKMTLRLDLNNGE